MNANDANAVTTPPSLRAAALAMNEIERAMQRPPVSRGDEWRRRCSTSERKEGVDVNSPSGRYWLRVAGVDEPGTHAWTEYRDGQDHDVGCFDDVEHAMRALAGAATPPDADEPEPVIPRPSVMAFARLMEATLRKHDAKKGGQQQWRLLDVYDHVNKAEGEMVELRHEVSRRPYRAPEVGTADIDALIINEAVDIANFLLMAVDTVRPLATDQRLEG